MQRCVVEEGGLAAEQFDELIAQGAAGRRRCGDLRKESLERGGKQVR